MKCMIPGQMYWHRGEILMRDDEQGGITCSDFYCDDIFPTFADGRRWIDKMMDGTHDKEPKVIGKYRVAQGR